MIAQAGGLLVAGATSGAGKSTVAAALGRTLTRRGLHVAPFKAQNMSNHAAVTPDGGEIGRAQAMQASACRQPTDRRMNPVLLKPAAGQRAHVVVMGDEVTTTDAVSYGPTTDSLKPIVLDAYSSLRRTHPWVIAEGAGGAAEINLLDRDLVNLPFARAAGCRSVIVVDIDPGGAYAAAFGTVELVPPSLRATIGGVIFNRFRGDASLLDSGNKEFERRTGIPILGVLPALRTPPGLWVEDSLDIVSGTVDPVVTAPTDDHRRPVRVAALRLPHLANPSDLDPLRVEPDVVMRWVTRPDELLDADLIIVPGSRATVADLAWLRATGLADAIALGDTNRLVLGICGGYQMLGRTIHDEIESGEGQLDGLALLDVETVFAAPKIVRCSTATGLDRRFGETEIDGYQIRWGRPTGARSPWLRVDGDDEGAANETGGGLVLGTSLHGILDRDDFRRRLLGLTAERRNRDFAPGPLRFETALDAQHERLADWAETHLEIERLVDLGGQAAAPGAEPGW